MKQDTVKSLIEKIGSKKMLRIERWRDNFKHWRVGIEWYGKDDYEFICEYADLRKCLICVSEYLQRQEHDRIKPNYPN
jgi:hypothetical protein